MRKVLWLLKKEQYAKLIIMFVIFIILLQGFHMMLLMKLENEEKIRKKHSIGPNEEGVVTPSSDHVAYARVQSNNLTKELLDSIVRKIDRPHILDSSGVYFIIPDIVSGKTSGSNDNLDVTLCLQTTANHLYHLKDLSNTWDGPVSVSVFTYGKDVLFAIYSIVYLHTCVKDVHDRVSFHLIFPVDHPPANLAPVLKFNFNCSSVDYLKIDRKRDNYQISNVQYPNNILRNVAIRQSESEYILVLDIDMVPSRHLRKHFVEFIKRQGRTDSHNHKTVYVLPSFESQKEDFVAKTKQILLNDWKAREVRPFYSEICWKCQRVTDYEQWRNSQLVDFMDVAYYLDWEDPWEPFYIAKRTILPLYDDRFKQYGFNRISQVCELHVAGFRFAVLNNGFVVHRGFKTSEGFHAKKDDEQERNSQLFREFKEGLKTRYPESKKQC